MAIFSLYVNPQSRLPVLGTVPGETGQMCKEAGLPFAKAARRRREMDYDCGMPHIRDET